MEETIMKFVKILALILSVALLSCAFIACDSETPEETTANETVAAEKIEVSLIIKDGSVTKYEGTVTCNGTLGNAIEVFCAGEFEEEFEVFNSNDLLTTIGELTGSNWKAYYEDEGQGKAFESIKTQVLEAGKTVVIVLE
jgi:hypothetical protein